MTFTRLTRSARRISAAAIGIVGGLAITVACSSSTNGTAATSAPAGGSSPTLSVPAPSASVSLPSVSVPASLPVSIPASIPALGGSKFCKDLAAMGNLGSSLTGSPGDLGKVEDALNKLVSEAPPEIKGDLQTLADYVKGAASGHIDPNIVQKLQQVETHLITYLTQHCHP